MGCVCSKVRPAPIENKFFQRVAWNRCCSQVKWTRSSLFKIFFMFGNRNICGCVVSFSFAASRALGTHRVRLVDSMFAWLLCSERKYVDKEKYRKELWFKLTHVTTLKMNHSAVFVRPVCVWPVNALSLNHSFHLLGNFSVNASSDASQKKTFICTKRPQMSLFACLSL